MITAFYLDMSGISKQGNNMIKVIVAIVVGIVVFTGVTIVIANKQLG